MLQILSMKLIIKINTIQVTEATEEDFGWLVSPKSYRKVNSNIFTTTNIRINRLNLCTSTIMSYFKINSISMYSSNLIIFVVNSTFYPSRTWDNLRHANE